ncbi:MAG: hypothetical protein JSU61_13415 [Fidelibacterota bacterium]|nr:MAG: hypothetical protein JSU61_13415 [Candidatus Neomarinimicrobiota bacterium]
MKKQILKISVHQTSKVIAITYVGLAVVFAVVMFIVISLFGDRGEREHALLIAVLYLVFMPFLAYLLVALFCAIYNAVAERFGGAEFYLEDTGSSEGGSS